MSATSELNGLADSLSGIGDVIQHNGLEEVRKTLIASTIANFDQSGRPRWKERTKPYPWPPLIKSGEMKSTVLRSLNGQWIRSPLGYKLIAKTTEYYGRAQQYGRPSNRLPARPYVQFTVEELKMLAATVGDLIKIKIKKGR
jgi:phage gpG-like protein